MPRTPPGHSPPRWPRFGRRVDATPAVGGRAPAPHDIPICWLSGRVVLRLNPPYTTAAVTRDGSTASASSPELDTVVGDIPFTATLYSATGADATNLAHWTVTYRDKSRMRAPELVVDLMARTDDERLRLLRIKRGERVRLTGVPPEFPEGASSLVVGGIHHEIGSLVRKIRFTTQSVIGVVPGVPGPWFRLGTSEFGGTDIIPF